MHVSFRAPRRLAPVAIAGVLALSLAACGDDDDDDAATDTTAAAAVTEAPTTDAPTTDAPTTEAPTSEVSAAEKTELWDRWKRGEFAEGDWTSFW